MRPSCRVLFDRVPLKPLIGSAASTLGNGTITGRFDLAGIHSQGYCFQIDLTRRALDRGLTVVEVPISFVEREIGDSKMNGDIVREAMVRVGQWGVKHRAAQLGRLLGWRPGESWHDLT